MASPVIVNTIITNQAASVTSLVVNLPSSLTAGRTLLALVRIATKDASTPTWPAGWTTLLDTVVDGGTLRTVWAWKKCAGTEGATATLTQATSTRFCAIAWQISGAADPAIIPPEISTVATGTSTSTNATAVTPTGGSKDYLFILAATGATSTTLPSGYSTRIRATEGTVDLNSCSKAATAASEDPAAWAISPSFTWITAVVALHPEVTVLVKALVGPNPEEDVTPALLVGQNQNLGQAIEEDLTVLPLTFATDLGVHSLLETFTVGNSPLATADFLWQRLGGGTRWQVVSNQAAFVGSAFGSEVAMCLTPCDGQTYRVSTTLAGWQRGAANDVSLGLIARKNADPASLTYYTAFVTKTATTDSIQLARSLAGTVTQIDLQNGVIATEGQTLELQVTEEFDVNHVPVTHILVKLGGITYINVIDPAILKGRYFGILGYLQGPLVPEPVLRLDAVRMQVPTTTRRRRGLVGLSALTGVR
ncbi:MAG TPA: hypothetical protein VJ816_04780 [Gemmatimonadales bacterium]|nr:hypothetical protein [Gemmatimonadales bacterium]